MAWLPGSERPLFLWHLNVSPGLSVDSKDATGKFIFNAVTCSKSTFKSFSKGNGFCWVLNEDFQACGKVEKATAVENHTHPGTALQPRGFVS